MSVSSRPGCGRPSAARRPGERAEGERRRQQQVGVAQDLVGRERRVAIAVGWVRIGSVRIARSPDTA